MKTKDILRNYNLRLILCCFLVVVSFSNNANSQIIIDHTCTDITAIPQSTLENAKTTLHIAYGHTSHGSQLTDGMTGLITFANNNGLGLNLPENIFTWNEGGTDGALDYRDYNANSGRQFVTDGARDLGSPDRRMWADDTRTYLDANPEVNVIIWAWCYQVNGTEEDINLYLNLMDSLEHDYPKVKFVYMTGHLSTGVSGTNVLVRNQQIRDYCKTNNKILYDFADIESYDPDGNYYGDKLADDGCNYDADNDGILETLPASAETNWKVLPDDGDSNWAINWQESHIEGVDWYQCTSAHTQALNVNLKAYAVWWLWMRLSEGNSNSASNIKIEPNTFKIYPNPAKSNTSIAYSLPENSDVEISLYDVTGRKVQTLFEEYQIAGEHTMDIELNTIEAGVFFLKLEAGTYTAISKCIVTH